ncbi:MAG: cytochrome b/b6 domain-containing protein [Candidatus Polarisedimenticolaceae bacterium]|nr:cytochrome b/b6 domain-containing protein [Candidatus Polarisedimenticolaceae bacterium]
MNNTDIKVWDPLIRLFHWGLVISFCIAFVSEDNLMRAHVYAGYTIIGLLIFRLIWGMIGTQHARFSDFVRPPHAAITYLKEMLFGRATHYSGHNPAGGLMIIMLLASLLLTSLTGLGTYHLGFGEEILEEVHEFFANFTLLLIFIHISGVLLGSLYHDENLIRAMFTGRKQRQE